MLDYRFTTSKKLFLAYATIFLFIVWRPLSFLYIHIDAAQRLPILVLCLSIVAYWRPFIKLLTSKPICIYLFVCIFMFVNGLVKHSYILDAENGIYNFLFSTIIPILVLGITAVAACTNYDKTLSVSLFSILIYCFLVLMKMTDTIGSGRFVVDSINANEVAYYASICIGMLFLWYKRLNKKKLFLLIALIPVTCIILTGSRMGLLSLFVLFIGYNLMNSEAKGFVKIVKIIVVLLVAWLAIDFVLNNTVAGERILTTKEATEERNAELMTGTFWDEFGDRGFMYYYSWPLFLEHPFTGIGVMNFVREGFLGYRLHTEYAAQYVENGLCGFIPYLFFLVYLFKHLKRKCLLKYGYYTRITVSILMLMFISIILSNFMLWSYDVIAVFLTYALMIPYVHESQNK